MGVNAFSKSNTPQSPNLCPVASAKHSGARVLGSWSEAWSGDDRATCFPLSAYLARCPPYTLTLTHREYIISTHSVRYPCIVLEAYYIAGPRALRTLQVSSHRSWKMDFLFSSSSEVSIGEDCKRFSFKWSTFYVSNSILHFL